MNIFAKIAAVCVTIVLAGVAAGADSATEPAATQPATRASMEVLERVQHNLQKVETVEADFVQEKNLAILNHVLTIRGHFALQKPDRLIWIIHEPVRYAIRIEGEEVQQWDEDTNRVDVIHLAGDPTFRAASEQIQAWFLGDYQSLAKSYDVDMLSEKPLTLSFSPRADTMVAKVLKNIDVTFGPGEQYIDMMVVREAGGDSTTLRFIHILVNQAIKEEVWRMPPNER